MAAQRMMVAFLAVAMAMVPLGAVAAGAVLAPAPAFAAPPVPGLPAELPPVARLVMDGPPAAWQDLLAVHELRLLGAPLAPVPAEPPTLPSEGIVAILALDGLGPGVLAPGTLAAYDALPAPARDALSSLLGAYLRNEALAREAFARVTPQDFAAAHSADTSLPAPDVDWAKAFAGQRAVLASAQAALPALQAYAASGNPAPPPVEACPALVLDLNLLDNVRACDVRFSLDLGGDDLYLNNAGGAGESIQASGNFGTGGSAVAFDLAGDDTYRGDLLQGGLTGGGFGSTGLLLEVAGNDLYDGNVDHAGAVNGGGEVGSGLLLDLSGDDVVRGAVGTDPEFHNQGGGVNGGSAAGAGLLVDLDGSDSYWGYNGGSGGVNGGTHGGSGALLDFQGNDRYEGTALNLAGVNGGAFTGQAFLFDGRGNDVYRGWQGSLGGVNGGAFIGVGLLVDGTGDDDYDGTNVHDGGVNGGSFNMQGAGYLFDFGGNDRFDGALHGSGGVNGGSFFGLGHLFNFGNGVDVYDSRVDDANHIRGINGGAVFGGAILYDGGGTGDLYRDVPGAAFAVDQTITLKGSAGNQFDCKQCLL